MLENFINNIWWYSFSKCFWKKFGLSSEEKMIKEDIFCPKWWFSVGNDSQLCIIYSRQKRWWAYCASSVEPKTYLKLNNTLLYCKLTEESGEVFFGQVSVSHWHIFWPISSRLASCWSGLGQSYYKIYNLCWVILEANQVAFQC